MSVHMKKHLTRSFKTEMIVMHYAGYTYVFPQQIAEKYKLEKSVEAHRYSSETEKNLVDPDTVFAAINRQYTKPGALLKGLRMRENISQQEMAKKLSVTQSDISQMEHGKRIIGRKIAQRIASLFDIDYKIFLL